jgi:hypothetical protein
VATVARVFRSTHLLPAHHYSRQVAVAAAHKQQAAQAVHLLVVPVEFRQQVEQRQQIPLQVAAAGATQMQAVLAVQELFT